MKRALVKKPVDTMEMNVQKLGLIHSGVLLSEWRTGENAMPDAHKMNPEKDRILLICPGLPREGLVRMIIS